MPHITFHFRSSSLSELFSSSKGGVLYDMLFIFVIKPCIFSIFENTFEALSSSIYISIVYILYIFIYYTIKYIQFSVLHIFLRYMAVRGRVSNCPHIHTSGRWHEKPPCPNSSNECLAAGKCLCV